MQEALWHLDAAHEITAETSNYMTVGDFNYAPTDSSQAKSLSKRYYKNMDIEIAIYPAFQVPPSRIIPDD